MTDEKHRCDGTTFDGWHHHRCRVENAKSQRDDKWYCAMHDPIKKQERRAKVEHQWELAAQSRDLAYKKNKLRDNIIDWCIEHPDAMPAEIQVMIKELESMQAQSV